MSLRHSCKRATTISFAWVTTRTLSSKNSIYPFLLSVYSYATACYNFVYKKILWRLLRLSNNLLDTSAQSHQIIRIGPLLSIRSILIIIFDINARIHFCGMKFSWMNWNILERLNSRSAGVSRSKYVWPKSWFTNISNISVFLIFRCMMVHKPISTIDRQ